MDTMTETYGMTTEIAIEDRFEGKLRTYVEVGVDDGDDTADLYAEDGDSSVTLRLSVDEIDDLIAALQRAKDTALANR